MSASDSCSIILWSADWTETTGQAIVTRRVVEYQSQIRWIKASYGRGGLRSMFGLFQAIARTYYSLFTRSANTIYIVCSRSNAGFLRDVPALLTAFFGVRVVVHTHGSDLPDLLNRPIIGWITKCLYGKCEIIVPSVHLLAPLTDISRTRLHLVENFARPVRRTIKTKKNHLFRILWNSNIMASKGIKELVQGARLARESGIALELVILGRALGDGESTLTEIEAYLNTLFCVEWITIRGHVTPEVAELEVAYADLVALPSNYPSECQPLAIVQAMCAGCKIIVADTPALRATLGKYPGSVVPRNPESISRAILVEYTSPDINPDIVADVAARFDPARFDAQMAVILRAQKHN